MAPSGLLQEVVPQLAANPRVERLSAHRERFPYLLSGCPSVGDFGLVAPLYAHLGRDPEPSRIMKARAPMVYRWVERMNAVDTDMPEFPLQQPEFFSGDAISETLLDILRLMASDFLPEMLGIFARVESWLVDHPGNPLEHPMPHRGAARGPGPFGNHPIELRGVPIELGVRHDAIWMAQRPMDLYPALGVADRDHANRMLDATGLRPLFDLFPSFRLERRQHEEYLVQTPRGGTPS